MKTLKELVQDELADMYDAEQRIVRALPKLAKAAVSADLQDAFESHLALEDSNQVATHEGFPL